MVNPKEFLIIQNFLTNNDFSQKAIAFIKPEYFEDHSLRPIFKSGSTYISKYSSLPVKEAMKLWLKEEDKNSSDEQIRVMYDIIDKLYDNITEVDLDWLCDLTEAWMRDRAIYLCITSALDIIDGRDSKKSPAMIPEMMSDALSVGFDSDLGHDYLDDIEKRYEFYHRKEEKLEFDLDILNKITNGGIPRKTLNVVMAPTGVGKSIFLCHLAASYLSQGKNVIYITLEMFEEEIAKRIDANLLNIPLNDLMKLEKESYLERMNKLRSSISNGKLLIREYPTRGATTNTIRHLLKEYKIKKGFNVDVVIVDYVNIAETPQRVDSEYRRIKNIAEEFRGLAVELKVPLWTATQTNRDGYESSDISLKNTSESYALNSTADFFIALIATEEFEESNQIMIKQLKNRYGDLNYFKKFVIGLDKSKMQFFDRDNPNDIPAEFSQQEEEDMLEDFFSGKQPSYEGYENVFKPRS